MLTCRRTNLPALAALAALVTLTTACEGGSAPQVGSSRSTTTTTTIPDGDGGTAASSPIDEDGVPMTTGVVVIDVTGTTVAIPATPTTALPTTALPTTEAPTTTTTGRRLYSVHGSLGVFPVSGSICAMDQAGAAGTIGAPEGSVVDAPEIGSISYGGEVTFSSTSDFEGTFQYSIFAYATSFTGGGSYQISWIDDRTSGLMDLYDLTGSATNPAVDEEEDSDQEMAMNVTMIGTC